ncbi:unnamed protein product [Boreogadus saida]
MAAQEQVCCGALPAVDQDLAPLLRSPGSLFGGPACLNKDSKAMESLLEPAGRCLSAKGFLVSNDVPGFGVQGAGSGIRPLVGSALGSETTSVAVPVEATASGTVSSGCQGNPQPCLGHRPPPCCNRHRIAVTVQRRCQSPLAVGGSGQGAQERLHLGRRLSQKLRPGARKTSDTGSKHPGGMVISQGLVGGGHLLADGGSPDARIVPEGSRASQPRLSSQHRRNWLALVADPWVVSTMTQGYRLQFWRRPRSPAHAKMTVSQRLYRALRWWRDPANIRRGQTMGSFRAIPVPGPLNVVADTCCPEGDQVHVLATFLLPDDPPLGWDVLGGRSCPLQHSGTLNPQCVDFLGFVAGSLSRYHMRSSHSTFTRFYQDQPFALSGFALRGIVPIGM